MFPSVKVGPANDFGTMNDKHLIFYHEKFHRDHPGKWGRKSRNNKYTDDISILTDTSSYVRLPLELLPDIKRSTKTTRSSAEQEQVIEDLQNQLTDLEKRFDDLSSQVYLKLSSISAECDKKIADFQRSMNDRAGAERSVDERRTSERSFMEYNAPSLPTKLSRFTTEDTSLPTTRLNRYTTEDFMRSILHMDGNNGHPRGMDNHSASASVPYAIPSLSQQPRLNRLGTLTLDDINRLVMHLENEGMVTDINAPTWTAPAPTNPVNHIASLSAEDILVALRSMDNPKGPDRDVDGSDNRNNKMSYWKSC